MESLLSSSSKKTPTSKVGDGKYNGKENSMQGDHPGILFFNQIKQQSGLRIFAFSILQKFL